MFTSVFSNIEMDSFTQQGENKGPELVGVALPCAPLRGPTHLPVDPCSLLDLIVFTFKQTVLALWRQSAVTLPGRPGEAVEEEDREIKTLFIYSLFW